MSEVDVLDNPHIKMAVAHETAKDRLVNVLADQIMSTKTWKQMNAKERKVCVRHIVSQATSKEGLQRQLYEELGVGYCAISWHLSEDGDKTGDEARALVKALGGLVSKNGALVMIMTAEDEF